MLESEIFDSFEGLFISHRTSLLQCTVESRSKLGGKKKKKTPRKFRSGIPYPDQELLSESNS